jgi:phenylalanyl-tRNA synthetase beta chain
MKYSYHWLKELSGTKKSAEQLSKLLMAHAFEVEGIEKYPHHLEGVVVGRVVSLEQHPSADRLRVAQVEVGRNDIRQIVCGAPNIAAEQKVAVALPGTVLPGDVSIGEATLRGVKSQGMICSAQELGIGDDHSGIFILPEEAPVGALFAKHFGLDDAIIEVKILPDRGSDAIAYQGLAREIAALDGYAPHFSERKLKPIRLSSYNRAPKVTIADKQGCVRYLGMAFKDVEVGESPLWLKVKLIVAGLRPVNNIVDITNYLMLLTGQPMHAFDADRIVGGITVRRAKRNEKLKLLTGNVVKLSTEDLVISDDKKALALAGVMGGEHAGITADTTRIFLEVAAFDGASVRRARTRHGLQTDASYRFERALDPELPTDVAREAAALIASIGKGKPIGLRDIYPKPKKSWKIRLTLDRVEHVLGVRLPLFEVVRFLGLLGLKIKKVSNVDAIDVLIPTRRPDLRDEWDLIEEVGRMYGYDRIAPQAPLIPLASTQSDAAKTFERSVKEYLAHAGFDEIMTYSFYGEKEISAAALEAERHLMIENPLSPDQNHLRLTLIPLMLSKVRENLRHFQSFDCFEWGSGFSRHLKTRGPEESKSLGLVTVLPKQNVSGEAFFSLKGRIIALFEALAIDSERISWEPLDRHPEASIGDLFHPTRSACVMLDGKVIGIVGEAHPKTIKAFGVPSKLAMAQFSAHALQLARKSETRFVPLQKFPYALRDISLSFPKKTTVADVESVLREVGAPLLVRNELFDIYEQEDEKSLAFHLFFGHAERTLSSQEVDSAFDRIVEAAQNRLGAVLRS